MKGPISLSLCLCSFMELEHVIDDDVLNIGSTSYLQVS